MTVYKNRRILAAFMVAAAGAAAAGHATATTETWFGANNESWNASHAWFTQTPGAGDVALFNGSGAGTNVALTATTPADGIEFNTASAAGYTIGAAGGYALNMSSGGYIEMTATDTASQTIAAPILINGTFNLNSTQPELLLQNNSSTATALMSIGNITGTAASGAYQRLQLAGVNAGVQTISGNITDGSNGGSVGVYASAGAWKLSGDNTFTGGLGIGGTVEVTSTQSLGAYSAGNANSVITLVGLSPVLRPLADITTSENVDSISTFGVIDTFGHSVVLNGQVTGYGFSVQDTSGTGKGVLTLAGDSVLAGDPSQELRVISLESGTLAATSDAALGGWTPGQLTIGFYGGTLQLDNFSTSASPELTTSSGGATAVSLGAATGMASTYNGEIGGTGLIYNGPGTLILAGASVYSGQTKINSGVLAVTNDGEIGTSSILFAGGTFQFQNYDSSFAFNAGNTSSASNNQISLGAALGAPSTLSGAITGPIGLVYNGPGTLILAGVNTYEGSTTVNGGMLETSTGAFGGGSFILNGGVLAIGSDGQVRGQPIDFNGGTLQFNNYTSSLNLTVAAGTASISLGAAAGSNSTLNGIISGARIGTGGLVYQGPGTLIWSAISPLIPTTYTGQTQVLGGTLAVAGLAGREMATSSGVYVASNGAFDISEASSSSNVNINGLAGSGGVNLGSRTLVITNTGADTFGGSIRDGGLGGGTGGSIVKLGSGALTLTGENSFTGVTTVGGGSLELDSSGTLNGGGIVVNGAGAAFFDFGGGITSGPITISNGTFDAQGTQHIQAGAVTVAASASNATTPVFLTVDGGAVMDAGALTVGSATGGASVANINTAGQIDAQSVTVAANGTINLLADALLSASGANSSNAGIISISGTGALAGPGTISNTGTIFAVGGATISAPVENNATGLVHVSGAGNVLFSGNVANAGIITIDTGSAAVFTATYSGAGSVTGAGTAFFDGTLSPGDPVKETFAGNVVLQSANNLVMQIGGTTAGSGYDQLVIAGSARLGGTLTVQLINGFTPTLGQTFQLIDPPSILGTFNTLDLPTLSGNLQWNTSDLNSGGLLTVTTPEPACLELAAVGAGLMLLVRRRKASA